MFDEMSFLFGTSRQITNQFNSEKNGNTIVKNTTNGVQSQKGKIEYSDSSGSWVSNKYTVTKSEVDNYIKSSVNASYETSGKNPYLSLLESFNGTNTNKKSLKLKASDFTYLRDIGVFPINRLMILRRYPEGTVVPVDLNDLDVEPISTVIGWVKEESDLLSYSVHETWETQQKWLHTLIREIIQTEFGPDIGAIVPIPGWGQGFMFGLLKKMGLTDYSATNLPLGDANLLREGVTRPHDKQGLISKFNFTLETVYEQKYIGGIDAGVAMNDIVSNVMSMATSDIRFLGKTGNKLATDIANANNNPANPEGWKKLIVDVISGAVAALKDTVTNLAKNSKPEKTPETDDTEGKKIKINKEKEALEGSVNKIGIVQKAISSILASTVARYQWPIRGALNQLSGDAATPWHLTIGNPHAPLLSMNNIKVSDCEVTMGNELSYNDLSKFTTVRLTLEQGRNLGKQEIDQMFGIGYKRIYKKK